MLNSDTIVRPVYYRIIERRGKIWAFKEGSPFINLFNAPDLDMEDMFSLFDTSMEKKLLPNFDVSNGAKQGYYIANILDKKYYYCSTEWSDIKAKLQELGIGKPDPIST